jgi:hypothetical protein
MSIHECDLNASSGSSPSEDNKKSGVSGDKGKGSRRQSRQAIIKRSTRKVATTHLQDESIDDFVKPLK